MVDDHPAVRCGLAQLMSEEEDLTVCGEAGSAEEALTAIPVSRPDIVLADVSLGGMDGFALTRALQAIVPDVPVLMISIHDEDVYAAQALRAGARGYLTKAQMPETMLTAIRKVLSGENFFNDSLAMT